MEFNGEALQCRMIEDGVVEMTFDLQNESVNKFNRVTMEEYREVVSLLRKERNLKGLLINSAKEAFIVGADITEFLRFFQIPQDELMEQLKFRQQIFLDMENLGIPSVCAINGYALGGGFEIVYTIQDKLGVLKTGNECLEVTPIIGWKPDKPTSYVVSYFVVAQKIIPELENLKKAMQMQNNNEKYKKLDSAI